MTPFFTRFSRPWLAAVAAAGAVWLVASVVLAAFAAGAHPLVGRLVVVLHLLGLVALLGSGVVYAVLFWRDYLDRKLFGD